MFGKKCRKCGTRIGGLFGTQNYGTSEQPLCRDCNYENKNETVQQDKCEKESYENEQKQKDMGKIHESNIKEVILFIEPPLGYSGIPKDINPELPEGILIYQNADKTLSLGGRLVSYITDCGAPKHVIIPRVKDSDRYEFFSKQAASERWFVYNINPLWRYSILISFLVLPSTAFKNEILRQQIYKEHTDLDMKLAYDIMRNNSNIPKEEAGEKSFEEASRLVGIKHAISKNDLADILSEGYEKWDPLRIAIKDSTGE